MTITIDQKDYQVPDTWNDLSLKQQLHCYSIAMMPLPRTMVLPDEEIHVKRIEITKYLLQLDQQYLDDWQEDRTQEDPESGNLQFTFELAELARTVTGFAFQRQTSEQDDHIGWSLNLGLTVNPWPHLVTPDGKTLYGPADALENLTIYELGMSFMLFERYIINNDMEMADQLLATLYRPGKPETDANERSGYQGDRRLPLFDHESTVAQRIPYFRQLPHLSKQLLLFWYASCRQAIVDAFPNVFRTQDARVERTGNDYAWAGVLLNLADGLANLPKVQQQPYYNALTYLSMLEDRRKEREREAAKRKSRAKR